MQASDKTKESYGTNKEEIISKRKSWALVDLSMQEQPVRFAFLARMGWDQQDFAVALDQTEPHCQPIAIWAGMSEVSFKNPQEHHGRKAAKTMEPHDFLNRSRYKLALVAP